ATLIAQPAMPAVATMTFNMAPGGQAELGMEVQYLGNVTNPSIDYDGGRLLIQEEYMGQYYLTLVDLYAGVLTDLLAAQVDHPYLTADGDYLTFSYGGDAYVASLTGGFR